MIRYQLVCSQNHEFETWFKDSGTCDRQLQRRHAECPVCGDRNVAKAVMAPRVSGTAVAATSGGPAPMAVMADGMRQKLRELRQAVESNCDYVGERFAEEARRIHYGEADPRGIYGEASNDDHKALEEEGIDVARIPWLPTSDA